MRSPLASAMASDEPYHPSVRVAPLQVLLIEDNDIDAFLLGEMMAHARATPTQIDRATSLSQGLERLGRGNIDLVLLDLTLPDSQYLETMHAVTGAFPGVPVIVCTGSDDEAMAVEAVRYGAQDYLVKGQVTVDGLTRSIRYAVERHRMLLALRDLSLVDELTGLYNRRGFMTLAASHVKQASRSGRRYLLVCGDLDGLKPINDTHGHKAGDEAIRAGADVLRGAFRSSDVLARLGGDEFAVLALETCADFEALILGRIQAGFTALNADEARPYSVAMSVGMCAFTAEAATSIETLIERADGELYKQKRGRQSLGLRTMGPR